MSPVTMREDEVQYYASPILVKDNPYFATLTSERLIIEGATTREFAKTSLLGAYPIPLPNGDAGMKLLIATPAGQKEMIWGFDVSAPFKKGEQEAWVSNITKLVGSNPLEIENTTPSPGLTNPNTISFKPEEETQKPTPAETISIIETVPEPAAETPSQTLPDLIPGENIIISTAGVRVKHTFFAVYLTNLRLILQNNSGKIGREFAISDLKDAAELESDAGEPEIALSIGMQSGLRQMILSFPTKPARDAWMSELTAKLPRPVEKKEEAAPERVGTFTPATNERTLVTTPNVRIKNRLSVIHLTNTRFVVDTPAGIMGEFALNTLNRAVRMASEIGEPGISLKIGSPQGVKEMHIVFSSVNDREAWMDALMEVIPDRTASAIPESREYTVTTVSPQRTGHTQQIPCPSCRAMNYAADEFCSFCGEPLHAVPEEPRQRRAKENRRERPVRERPQRVKAPYNGNFFGFITRPSDAFSYYCRDGIKEALPFYFISGAIWSILTVLIIAFILPAILKLNRTDFPILTSIQSDPIILLILILILFAMWAVCVLLHAVISAVLSRLFEPGIAMGDAMSVVMKSSMTYAVVGWIPIIGMFAAGIWGSICAWKGLENGQDMASGVAAAAAFAGCIIVYAVLLLIGGL